MSQIWKEEYCTPSFVIADEAISEILMKKSGGRLRNSFMMCCTDFTSFHSLPLFLPEFCKGFLCPTSLWRTHPNLPSNSSTSFLTDCIETNS